MKTLAIGCLCQNQINISTQIHTFNTFICLHGLNIIINWAEFYSNLDTSFNYINIQKYNLTSLDSSKSDFRLQAMNSRRSLCKTEPNSSKIRLLPYLFISYSVKPESLVISINQQRYSRSRGVLHSAFKWTDI
jgi:hypothetical protein